MFLICFNENNYQKKSIEWEFLKLDDWIPCTRKRQHKTTSIPEKMHKKVSHWNVELFQQVYQFIHMIQCFSTEKNLQHNSIIDSISRDVQLTVQQGWNVYTTA